MAVYKILPIALGDKYLGRSRVKRVWVIRKRHLILWWKPVADLRGVTEFERWHDARMALDAIIADEAETLTHLGLGSTIHVAEGKLSDPPKGLV